MELTLNNCKLVEGLAEMALQILEIARWQERGAIEAYCEKRPELREPLRKIEAFRRELKRQEKAEPDA